MVTGTIKEQLSSYEGQLFFYGRLLIMALIKFSRCFFGFPVIGGLLLRFLMGRLWGMVFLCFLQESS